MGREPIAEAPAAATADAPGSPPSEYTPGTGFGAEVATRETGSAASASATSDSAAGADCGAVAAAVAAVGAPPAGAPLDRAAGADRRGGAALASIAIGFRLPAQRRCHPATPEYRRLRAEPGPPAPRRHVSDSAPAARIRFRPEPARPLRRQRGSCSVPVARNRLRAKPVRAPTRRSVHETHTTEEAQRILRPHGQPTGTLRRRSRWARLEPSREATRARRLGEVMEPKAPHQRQAMQHRARPVLDRHSGRSAGSCA